MGWDDVRPSTEMMMMAAMKEARPAVVRRLYCMECSTGLEKGCGLGRTGQTCSEGEQWNYWTTYSTRHGSIIYTRKTWRRRLFAISHPPYAECGSACCPPRSCAHHASKVWPLLVTTR
jgi:hypothetical protein